MADRGLIADARQLAASIPEGVGVLRSLDATRLARARVVLGDLADELERVTELQQAGRRVLTNADELDPLPGGTLIVDQWGTVWDRTQTGWNLHGTSDRTAPRRIVLPGVVLWQPGVSDRG